MQTENVVGAVILVLAIAVILVIRLYTSYKDGKRFSLNEFIDLYGDEIVKVLKDSIRILSLKIDNYSSKEEYEKAIIETTVEYIKSNYMTLDVDIGILADIIDSGDIADFVYSVLQKNYKEAFSELSKDIIEGHSELYNKKVLEK